MTERSAMEMYQAFMAGYVRRINLATLNVMIGGIRIGSAKYTRLAQINLSTRVITFSKFAIENVPERGRRYLVLHELAHVLEANHNRHFWDLVGKYEPNYKQIGKALDLAFKRNVREELLTSRSKIINPVSGRLELPKLLVGSNLVNQSLFEIEAGYNDFSPADEDASSDSFECMEHEFEAWEDALSGTISGGTEDFVAQGNGLSAIAV
jgi:Protein of unknown function DUF45